MKPNSRYHPSLWTSAQWLIFVVALILLLLLTVSIKGAAPTTFSFYEQIDRTFIDKLGKQYVSLKQNHALVIGVIKNGQKEVFTYGETQKGNGIKPDKNAVFEIGQMSEVFTTSLLALLEMEGKISSLEPVGAVLKGVKVPKYQRTICQTVPNVISPPEDFRQSLTVCFPDMNGASQVMVLCDLATHTAGLPTEPNEGLLVGANPYKNFTVDKLNKYVGTLAPNEAFGFRYNYSMVETALLGEALSVRAKKNYANLLKDKILGPLSMTHTFINPNAEQKRFFLNGHTQRGNPTPHRDYNALSPAMGIRSSVPDLLTLTIVAVQE